MEIPGFNKTEASNIIELFIRNVLQLKKGWDRTLKIQTGPCKELLTWDMALEVTSEWLGINGWLFHSSSIVNLISWVLCLCASLLLIVPRCHMLPGSESWHGDERQARTRLRQLFGARWVGTGSKNNVPNTLQSFSAPSNIEWDHLNSFVLSADIVGWSRGRKVAPLLCHFTHHHPCADRVLITWN